MELSKQSAKGLKDSNLCCLKHKFIAKNLQGVLEWKARPALTNHF